VGANAFQIGTINFVNPNAGMEILEGLENYCKEMGIDKLSEVTASRII
ncbi:MAG: dihydroorotate dehydrogenase, partial [Ignavibacteriae bacterium]|nr:dihydroorotate dehydrogenase [Ignavibacteriota bacterium]